MRSKMSLFGITMIVLAAVVALLFIVIPAVMPSLVNSPLVGGVLDLTLCKGHEDLIYSYNAGIGGSTSLGCFNPVNGFERDVNSRALVAGVVGTLTPLIIGIAVLVDERRRQVQPYAKLKNSEPAAFLSSPGFQMTLDTGDNVIVKAPDGRFSVRQQGTSTSPRSFSDRLTQLESAFDAGLITETEYERKRQEIVREL